MTALSDGRADNARPCVPKRRCRASAIRRGSAEHPTDNCPWACGESDRDMLTRYVAVLGAASGGASNDGVLRDANDRRLLAGPAPALPSTEATTIARTAKADGQLGERADSNARGRRVGGAAQASPVGGLFASLWRIGPRRPSRPRPASPVGCRSATTTSMTLPGPDVGEAQAQDTRQPGPGVRDWRLHRRWHPFDALIFGTRRTGDCCTPLAPATGSSLRSADSCSTGSRVLRRTAVRSRTCPRTKAPMGRSADSHKDNGLSLVEAAAGRAFRVRRVDERQRPQIHRGRLIKGRQGRQHGSSMNEARCRDWDARSGSAAG